MPLVNEVVIGLKDKDKFNASEPKDDGQFADYVTNPTLPALLEVLFGAAGVKAPTNFPRTDLVAAFLTGVDGREQAGRTSSCPSSCASTPRSPPTPRRVAEPPGRAGRRQRGLPERPPAGRRRGRHRAARGDGCAVHVPGVNTAVGCKASDAPAGSLKYTDGAYISSSFFANEFPYLRAPLKGSPNDDNAIKRAAP